uniref:Uncharacterized protein n=1 Tax=Octactis speculum TaxID=3111310 RepID=A0A7S2CQB0_9STRA|mmetsp:Transcript_38625/g.52365  ORF Transcript_38625/g.52365 Transcript_38625/m.52365 type:complete len:196 (+) Transcript_38625:95-682(+)
MGCTSGGIGSFIGNPCELAMVRLSADAQVPAAERRGYKNAIDCIMRIVKEEGVTALWTGATPTVLRAMLLSSSVLGCYSEAKEILVKTAPSIFVSVGSTPTMFAGTTIASFIANVVCCPFDVIKSRIQTMPKPESGQPPRYSGMVDCLLKSTRQEGTMVLYRGFTPAFVKLAPYTIISLMVVDKITIAITGKSGF